MKEEIISEHVADNKVEVVHHEEKKMEETHQGEKKLDGPRHDEHKKHEESPKDDIVHDSGHENKIEEEEEVK